MAQLQAWGERNGVAVVAQGQNADAASVAYDALQAMLSHALTPGTKRVSSTTVWSSAPFES